MMLDLVLNLVNMDSQQALLSQYLFQLKININVLNQGMVSILKEIMVIHHKADIIEQQQMFHNQNSGINLSKFSASTKLESNYILTSKTLNKALMELYIISLIICHK